MNKFSNEIETALKLDQDDDLRKFREEFILPDKKIIYLDGNSLGMLPRRTKEHLSSVIDNQWGDRLIRSWNEEWYGLAEKCGKKISNIIGAGENEVIVADSTSINLYKLVQAALKLNGNKTKIITDEFNFPSDHYILQGIINRLSPSYKLEVIKSRDGITISEEDLIGEIDENTALAVLSHAAFKSAFLYDMNRVTYEIHRKGALVLWDLSHSAGVVDFSLNKAGADFAIGCTYKYMNGGPGAPAFLYVRKDLQDKITPPIWGWFGDQKPFDFNLDYQPAEGMKKFLVGTPPIISLSAVDSGIDLILEAGIEKIRAKSRKQTDYLIYLFNSKLQKLGFGLGSPQSCSERGSHVSIRHPEAKRIYRAMTDENNDTIVIPDFRAPDNIRIGISPLYNTFEELWKAADIIEKIVNQKYFLRYGDQLNAVT